MTSASSLWTCVADEIQRGLCPVSWTTMMSNSLLGDSSHQAFVEPCRGCAWRTPIGWALRQSTSIERSEKLLRGMARVHRANAEQLVAVMF